MIESTILTNESQKETISLTNTQVLCVKARVRNKERRKDIYEYIKE